MNFNAIPPQIPYEGCRTTFDDADVVILGVGYDGTASYRPGSRFAPVAIRAETFYSQEDYSPYFQRDLSEKAIHDAGDLDLPPDNKAAVLRMIYNASKGLLEHSKKPCFIGGEHLITFPAFEAALEMNPDVRLVQIDAHLDLIDELFGEKYSHGTVMRRCFELMGEQQNRLYQVAIRSGSKEEFAFAEAHTRLFPFHTRDFIHAIDELRDVPIYLTVDMDVLDPSLLPGTGTPEAGGIFFPELIEFFKALDGLNIIAADLVELSPRIDPTNNSTITASKTLRELLMIL